MYVRYVRNHFSWSKNYPFEWRAIMPIIRLGSKTNLCRWLTKHKNLVATQCKKTAHTISTLLIFLVTLFRTPFPCVPLCVNNSWPIVHRFKHAVNLDYTASSRSFDLLNSMICGLERSADLRWLFYQMLRSSLDDLVSKNLRMIDCEIFFAGVCGLVKLGIN